MTKSEQIQENAVSEIHEDSTNFENDTKENAINNIIVENKADDSDVTDEEFAKIETIKPVWEPVLSVKNCENVKIQEKRKQYRKDCYGLLPIELEQEDKFAYEDSILTAKAFNQEVQSKEISKGISEKQYGDFIETSLTLYDGLIFEQLTKEQKEKLEKFENVMNLIKELNLEAIVTPIFDITQEIRVKKIPNEIKEEIIEEEKEIPQINTESTVEENAQKAETLEEIKEVIPEAKTEEKEEQKETEEKELDLSDGIKLLEEDKGSELIIDESQETDLEKYLQMSDEESTKESK